MAQTTQQDSKHHTSIRLWTSETKQNWVFVLNIVLENKCVSQENWVCIRKALPFKYII